jgi:hypothetical protein
MVATALAAGIGLLLAIAPVWTTPFLLVLSLLPRAQALGPVGILAGVLAGTVSANPLGTSGYQVGEALGFPFLGLWGGLVLAVLVARAAGEVAAFLARVAWMVAMVLRK